MASSGPLRCRCGLDRHHGSTRARLRRSGEAGSRRNLDLSTSATCRFTPRRSFRWKRALIGRSAQYCGRCAAFENDLRRSGAISGTFVVNNWGNPNRIIDRWVDDRFEASRSTKPHPRSAPWYRHPGRIHSLRHRCRDRICGSNTAKTVGRRFGCTRSLFRRCRTPVSFNAVRTCFEVVASRFAWKVGGL